jgi:forespore regulator of the sigma-K checkpoint
MKITYVIALLLCSTAFSFGIYVSNDLNMNEKVTVIANNKQISETEIEQEKKSYETLAPLKVEVVLQRVYLDGEASEEVFKQTIWSMADFWAQYEDWQLVDQEEGVVVFQKEINDISPLLKANGYFGIDQEGRLTIYQGNPEGEKVIQSFFQIDLEKLESNLHEQLKEGIVIMTKDRYSELLQTLKVYELK